MYRFARYSFLEPPTESIDLTPLSDLHAEPQAVADTLAQFCPEQLRRYHDGAHVVATVVRAITVHKASIRVRWHSDLVVLTMLQEWMERVPKSLVPDDYEHSAPGVVAVDDMGGPR